MNLTKMTSLVNCSDGKISDLLLTLHGVVLMFAAPSRRSMTRARHWTGSATTVPLAPTSGVPGDKGPGLRLKHKARGKPVKRAGKRGKSS